MKRTPIRRASKKKNSESATRRELLKRLVDERGEECQARTTTCTGFAVDAHEVLQRSAQGSAVDPENILLICRPCHNYIHQHPGESFERGWLRHSWEKEAP